MGEDHRWGIVLDVLIDLHQDKLSGRAKVERLKEGIGALVSLISNRATITS